MVDTVSLLPPNATALERAAAATSVRLDALPVPLRALWDPAACPVVALPWLAFAFGVEDWDSTWSEQQRRDVIAQSIPIKQHRGTIGAVQAAIASFGIAVRVQEWFNQVPQGAPYTYRLLINVDQTGFTKDQLKVLLSLIERAKNLRSHVETIIPSALVRSVLVVAAVASTGATVDVIDDVPRYADGASGVDLYIDAAVNGEASTLSAIEALHRSLHVTMPAANYW